MDADATDGPVLFDHATRFPAVAPWMATRWPTGPEPITIRSFGFIRSVFGLPIDRPAWFGGPSWMT